MKFYVKTEGPATITDDRMRAIADFMNDDIREYLHAALAPCTPEAFLLAYIQKDPDFQEILDLNFDLIILDDETAALVDKVAKSETWDDVIAELDQLAEITGLSETWKNADGDNFELVIRRIQNILNVNLGV